MTGTGDGIRTDFGETVKPGSTKTGKQVRLEATQYDTRSHKIIQHACCRFYINICMTLYDIVWLYDMIVIESIEGGKIQHRYRIHWRLGLHGVAGLRSTRAGSGCREGPWGNGMFFFQTILTTNVSNTYPLSRWSWRSPAAACGWNLWPTPKRHRDTAEASHKTSGLKVLMWRFSLYSLRTQLLERLERPSLMIPTLCQMIPSTSITLNPNLDLQVKVSLARALIMNPDLFLGFLAGGLVVPILASPLTATEVGVASSLPPLRPWNRRFDYQCFLGDNFENMFFRKRSFRRFSKSCVCVYFFGKLARHVLIWNRYDIFDFTVLHMDHSWCMKYIVCGHL